MSKESEAKADAKAEAAQDKADAKAEAVQDKADAKAEKTAADTAATTGRRSEAKQKTDIAEAEKAQKEADKAEEDASEAEQKAQELRKVADKKKQEATKKTTATDVYGVDKTDPTKSANENVEAGGHPTGTCPAGTT